MKKAFYGVINAISIIIIVFSLFALLSVVLTRPGQAPRVLGHSAFRVLTGSMEPEIPQDALLIVRRTQPEELKVGDVITFFSADPALRGGVNTHRIVEIEVTESGEPRFITKGDANYVADTYPVIPEQLIGKAVGKSLLLGRLCGAISNPFVFVPVIFLPLLLLLLGNMRKTLRLARDAVLQEEQEAREQAAAEQTAGEQAAAEQAAETTQRDERPID